MCKPQPLIYLWWYGMLEHCKSKTIATSYALQQMLSFRSDVSFEYRFSQENPVSAVGWFPSPLQFDKAVREIDNKWNMSSDRNMNLFLKNELSEIIRKIPCSSFCGLVFFTSLISRCVGGKRQLKIPNNTVVSPKQCRYFIDWCLLGLVHTIFITLSHQDLILQAEFHHL